jgi:hypothetical protein
MTAKEKAKELRDKMYLKIPSVYDPTGLPHFPIAKQCALIVVDEILDVLEIPEQNVEREYWQDVKHEINQL